MALFYLLLISLLPLSLRHLLHTADRILITLRNYSLEKECCGELGARVKPRFFWIDARIVLVSADWPSINITLTEVNIICSNKIDNFHKYVNRKLACKSGIGAIKDFLVKWYPTLLSRLIISTIFLDQCLLLTMALCRISSNELLKMFQYQMLDLQMLVFFKFWNVWTSNPLVALIFYPLFYFKILPLSLLLLWHLCLSCFTWIHFLPSIWKSFHVKPIFKKGDSSLVSNYRPISLTCTSCKVMEGIIHDQLLSYLHSHKLISDNQHGFLTRRSTGTNLLSCFHDWHLSIQSKKVIDTIYIDFHKAFDSLVHNKILAKLNSYGVTYELLYWIKVFFDR